MLRYRIRPRPPFVLKGSKEELQALNSHSSGTEQQQSTIRVQEDCLCFFLYAAVTPN